MSAMYQTFQNTPIFQTAWRDFLGSKWTDEVNVRDFIQNNYTQYDGDESFLAAPTSATHLLWERLQKLQKEEHEKGGVLECETEIVSSLTAYGPGYIDPELKDLERIVGLQTDKPLKRAFMPFGGIKMAEEAAKTYGYHVNPKFHKIFTEYQGLKLMKIKCASRLMWSAARASCVLRSVPHKTPTRPSSMHIPWK